MCGIVGMIIKKSIDRTLAEKMSSSLGHRGPDDSGIKVWDDDGVAFGHKRLSIIDLSPAGRNPISNEDGTIWIIFNGEIYNYRALRRTLKASGHKFSSETDAEVIIHAYEEWGDDYVKQLRGMFAYAVYDRRQKPFRILLVRDRIGIKPLFYYLHNDVFLFASEIKALLEYPGINRAIDESAIFDYPTYGYIPTPKTIYTYIRKLPAGHILSFENYRVKIYQYWDVTFGKLSSANSLAEAVEKVKSATSEAIKISLASDVPVGVLLSGGVDSSSVVALMTKTILQKFHTFTMGFDVPEHSETHYARLIADRYGTEHHESVIGFDSLSKILPIIVKLYDEPYADSSAIPTYYLCKMAREHVKAVLSGDGGDEIFAGYNWYNSWIKEKCTSRLSARQVANYASFIEIFSPSEKRNIFNPAFIRKFDDYDDYWYFRKYWHEELDPLTRVQYLDLKTYLCDDILTKVDRSSMAVSLEVRPPLLDHRLVELSFSMPVKFRAPLGQKKYLYKKAVKNLVPDEILNRPKKGFSVPWYKWIADHAEWLESKFYEAGLPEIFSSDIPQLYRRYKKGNKAWALLMLKEWIACNM